MKQIPLGKSGKFALVDDEDYDFLMQWKWRFDKDGYVIRLEDYHENGKRRQRRHSMHRVIMQTPKRMQTDHWDMNRSNNQRYNLRIATCAQNHMNRISFAGSSSKYKGVSWCKGSNRWQVFIGIKGKSTYLGLFTCEIAAARAYNAAALEHFGEFARINEI